MAPAKARWAALFKSSIPLMYKDSARSLIKGAPVRSCRRARCHYSAEAGSCAKLAATTVKKGLLARALKECR